MACMKTALMLLPLLLVPGRLLSQSAPVPQPFPGAGTPGPVSAPAARPAEPASSGRTAERPPASAAAPAPRQTPQPPPAAPASSTQPAQPAGPALPGGVPLYPTAEYIATYEAGAGQQFILYGSNLPFAEIVAYYRTVLKTGGNEVFRAPMPPTHQFTLGRYNEERMAFPPSVVVKDYTWNSSPGYLHVVGTTEKRYKTSIQIVAPGPNP